MRGGGCPACGPRGWILWALLGGIAIVYVFANRGAAPGGGGSAAAGPSAVAWAASFDAAMAKAAETGRPVFLAFEASWCGPCKMMDANVFSQQAAAKVLTGWVPVHIDVDENGKLAREYGVSGVPSFVALSPQGKVLARTEGYLPMEEFAAFIAQAEARQQAASRAAG